jgi:2-hydroxy-3-keto-5-methylthiopentenyl-1-phosphate phosphatase
MVYSFLKILYTYNLNFIFRLFEKKKIIKKKNQFRYNKVSEEFKKAGFTRENCNKILNEAHIAIRPKFDEFFKICFHNRIPYHIISGGLDLVFYVFIYFFFF